MLVVRVELWSAITGLKTELARLDISNVGATGGNPQVCDYQVRTYRGRSQETLDEAMLNSRVQRRGFVRAYPRMADHVWNLVAKSLQATGYGFGKGVPERDGEDRARAPAGGKPAAGDTEQQRAVRRRVGDNHPAPAHDGGADVEGTLPEHGAPGANQGGA